jgi:uncharacterized membrane protein YgcG
MNVKRNLVFSLPDVLMGRVFDYDTTHRIFGSAKFKKDLDAANKKLAEQETKIAAYSGKGGGGGGGGSGGGHPKSGSGKGSGGGGGSTAKIKCCFRARDYGSCNDEKNCQWSHDPEVLKAARKQKKAEEGGAGGDSTAAFPGKGGGKKGGGKAKAKAKPAGSSAQKGAD